MIFVGKMMDYRQERCSSCSFNEDFYCHSYEMSLDKIDDCKQWDVSRHWYNYYLCRGCLHSFRGEEIYFSSFLKCEMRELDSDWCVLAMKKCPIGKWE